MLPISPPLLFRARKAFVGRDNSTRSARAAWPVERWRWLARVCVQPCAGGALYGPSCGLAADALLPSLLAGCLRLTAKARAER